MLYRKMERITSYNQPDGHNQKCQALKAKMILQKQTEDLRYAADLAVYSLQYDPAFNAANDAEKAAMIAQDVYDYSNLYTDLTDIDYDPIDYDEIDDDLAKRGLDFDSDEDDYSLHVKRSKMEAHCLDNDNYIDSVFSHVEVRVGHHITEWHFDAFGCPFVGYTPTHELDNLSFIEKPMEAQMKKADIPATEPTPNKSRVGISLPSFMKSDKKEEKEEPKKTKFHGTPNESQS
jgi:hypothetical protein